MGQSKLTMQVLSAYLPYKVKAQYLDSEDYEITTGELVRIDTGVINGDGNEDVIITCGEQEFDPLDLIDCEFQLLLRPLSALTDEIEHNGERFVPIDNLIKADNKVIVSNYVSDGSKAITITITYKLMGDTFTDFIINRNTVDNTDYCYVQKLLEWHFDVFSLLDSGDALPLTDPPSVTGDEG